MGTKDDGNFITREMVSSNEMHTGCVVCEHVPLMNRKPIKLESHQEIIAEEKSETVISLKKFYNKKRCRRDLLRESSTCRNICDAFLILKNLILSFKNKVNFIFTAQYHKSQIAFRGFTVCTADDALCPQSLESDQDKTF